MINYQGEVFTETEFYGREILEAIQLTNKFPISKKKLTSSLEKMIHETKRHLGIHMEGEVMHLRDRHEPRATEHGIREKRKYTKRW